MNKYKDFFDCSNECGGKLSLKDNSKTPTGLLVCGKCKSLFRIEDYIFKYVKYLNIEIRKNVNE